MALTHPPLLLLLLSLSFFLFTVFAEDLDSLPPSSSHYPVAVPPHNPHPHPYPHPPTPTSAPTPAPHHHHHHHHHHSPAGAPAHPPTPYHKHPPSPTPSPVKPPVHHNPPTPSPVSKPPASHHYPPAPAPVPVPAKPPTHHYLPPVHAPAHPPVPVHPFPRSFVAVQGVVYCKSCKYPGADTLLGATPALGAVVKLQCNNTRYPVVTTAKTDKNGYFFLQAPKSITTFGAHKCRVFLVTSPSATCQKPSNLHGGVAGALLKPEKPFVSNKLPFLLYTVGPLAFEPKCPHY